MNLALAARLLRVLAHLLRGLAICALGFPWMRHERRMACIGRWSAQLLRIFRVSVDVASGGTPADAGLWVANHVSWLDVFVIDAVFPGRFVAKSEVRRWPLLGVLSALAGTLFVDRASARSLKRTVETLAGALRRGERIVVFPEGTSAAQGDMQPFRANLFEAAVAAPAAVQPLAIRYLDPNGHPHPAVEYFGDTSLADSILALLSGPPVHARLETLAALAPGAGDRRALAREARDAIERSLARGPGAPAYNGQAFDPARLP